MGRRKSHHAHETTDAYAEGWDACLNWCPNTPEPVNPYTVVDEDRLRKQSAVRQASQLHDYNLWNEGFGDCRTDLQRDDLPSVSESDFKHAPRSIPDEPDELGYPFLNDEHD